MSRALPTSLSPHICILASPDLETLLSSASLPSLPQILQSFSPLSQVSTRTTSLTPVPHQAFHLRFSNLVDIEAACKEDEEYRALRAIDWIGGRISRRCAEWVEHVEREREMLEAAGASRSTVDNGRRSIAGQSLDGAGSSMRTPWWDELRRCAEGDTAPSRMEGWNHPAAVILAVSTASPNPLQAITALHSRQLDLPPWVDPTHLRYTLIIHPPDSPLSDEEATALFNAIKRQYGLHIYLLPLSLPSPPPPPVPAPPLLPQLPPNEPQADFNSPDPSRELPPARPVSAVPREGLNALRLSEPDIQATAKFVREFVTQSLIPWMERSVLEWNENYSSTRRLPSRLFSSTRRLFGSGYGSSSPSPAPTHTRSSTLSNTPQAAQAAAASNAPGAGGAIGQQRRLAEFATVLGDYKLATGVWESLRKDGKAGAEVLPLLLAPGPNVALHAQYALAGMAPAGAGDMHAHVQLRALKFAVRWEAGIAPADFTSDALQGERWLMWASGNAEEAPSALLLAHAAHLCARKRLRRHAALWYLIAANRLEKCGIKPLTVHFLRRAHELYQVKLERTLSPSFWDSEGRTPDDWQGFEAIQPGIESALGKLLYTTGDVEGAVRVFLQLIRPAPLLALGGAIGGVDAAQTDRVILEDFHVAFKHFLSTTQGSGRIVDFKLPITFCSPRQTRVRLPREGLESEKAVWESREEDWRSFWKPHGKERLVNSGKAAVSETFWLDLVLHNPLSVEVELANVTVHTVHESSTDETGPSDNFVDAEVLDSLSLDPGETRTVPLAIVCRQPASLIITEVAYDFLSLLPNTEPLRTRGRRLHDTPQQRLGKVYAPDLLIKVDVEDAGHRLSVNFADDGDLVFAQGECKQLRLWLSNEGTEEVGEVWMVAGVDDHVWVDEDNIAASQDAGQEEVLRSDNSLAPRKPYRIPLAKLHVEAALRSGASVTLPVSFHADRLVQDAVLSLLLVYRESDGDDFHAIRLRRNYEVLPLLDVSAAARPSRSLDHMFTMNVEVDQLLAIGDIRITQLTTLSPSWKCEAIARPTIGTVSPQQTTRISFGINPWEGRADALATEQYAVEKLGLVVDGRKIDPTSPPPIDLLCTHLLEGGAATQSMLDPATQHFVHSARRRVVARSTAAAHPYVPSASHPAVFPLYHPAAVDVLVHWALPAQARAGFVLAAGVELGAGHAALRDALARAAGAPVGRSMYAETARERAEVLEGVRGSVWNREMDPVVVTVADGEAERDFDADGPCHEPVTFTLRNYSLTHTSRFTLRLSTPTIYPPVSDLLPPQYSGRLTFRGELPPTGSATVRAKLSISRPGVYALNGWTVETEVGELSSSSDAEWRSRHRYLQGPTAHHRSCLIVSDIKQ